MSAVALTGLAMFVNIAAGSVKDGETELSLLRDAASASFYAGEEMECRGFSRRASVQAADRALGRDFKPRMIAAANRMKVIWGEERVEEATTLLAIGHRIAPEYCRKAAGMVERARRALIDLERRLGAQ